MFMPSSQPLPIHHYKLHNYHPFSSPSTLTPLHPSKSHHHRISSTSTSFPFPFYQSKPQPQAPKEQPVLDDFLDEDHAIGDCLVFEEGVFEGNEEDPFPPPLPTPPEVKKKLKQHEVAENVESLVPEKWKEVVVEINLSKKEKRAIARELKFGSKVEKKWRTLQPGNDLGEYLTYKQMKLSQLKPAVLDDPVELPSPAEDEYSESGVRTTTERVAPRNPRTEVAGEGLDSINEFFSSGDYVPGEVYDDRKPKSFRKLFTKEEKVLLNRRIPSISEASSDGLSAIHKAILGKKQAILNYLLRESANPFIRDKDGATLMHYAALTASSPAIKILLLYNVDTNLGDYDGWTPLHLAVQTQRTDIVKLLLIKGAEQLKTRMVLLHLISVYTLAEVL